MQPPLDTLSALPVQEVAPAIAERDDNTLYLDALQAFSEGRPDDATAKLTRLLEKNAMHAGAWLDLAISQCELGNAEAAERLFREIERRFHQPQGIRDLIASYRATGCAAAKRARQLFSAKLGRGYDSNVNQASSDRFFSYTNGYTEAIASEGLPRGDYFSTFSADASIALGSSETTMLAQARGVRHDHIAEQDSYSLLLALEKPWQLAAWRGRASLAYGIVQLGSVMYQRQGQILLRASPPLALPGGMEWNVSGNYSRVIYPTRPQYNAGTLDLGTNLSYAGKLVSMAVSGGILADRGAAARPGENRHGWYATANVYAPLGHGLVGELGLTRQQWRSQKVYYPTWIDIVRQQETSQLRLGLQIPLRTGHTLLLEGRQVWNQENITLLKYKSRSLQLSWRADNW